MAIREIVKDEAELVVPCERYEEGRDAEWVDDLLDTAEANRANCAGLACNQIGGKLKLIVVKNGEEFMVMKNPYIIKRSGGTYVAVEACLSLSGAKPVVRHKQITVMYEDKYNKQRRLQCNGRLAQIIQHECDHLKGVLI